MKFFKHLVSFGATMLSLPDPNADKYEPPRIVSETRDSCGNVVEQTVRASNHHDATKHRNGATIQGDRSLVATHTGYRKWKVRAEDWDTKIDE